MCFYILLSQNKTPIGHPERTKYAKLFAVERSEQQKVEERSDEEIYKRLPQAFPRANELFRVHKRYKKTQVCANILRREILRGLSVF